MSSDRLLPRSRHLARLRDLLAQFPAVGLLGARQVGKTTLARQLASTWTGPVAHFDLEDPDTLARLDEPKLALGGLDGLIVIDEVQRRPELFPVLRVLMDRPASARRFLLLGSASPELLRQSSESLAGRIAYHSLRGLSTDEVGMVERDRLWLRGGFPRSFLAPSDAASGEWCRQFVSTFLERDIPQLGNSTPALTLHRFWRMVAHYHGQVWSGAEPARTLGVSEPSVRRYLDLLTGALVLRQLPPWRANLKKRQVKSPKVYVVDTGILHALLGVENHDLLASHPKAGASWEGFVSNEVVRVLGARDDECFFWATHGGAELDLLVVRGQQRRGFEIKRTTAPRSTRSMHHVRQDLGLDVIEVVHAGTDTFRISDGLRAVAFERIEQDLEPLA